MSTNELCTNVNARMSKLQCSMSMSKVQTFQDKTNHDNKVSSTKYHATKAHFSVYNCRNKNHIMMCYFINRLLPLMLIKRHFSSTTTDVAMAHSGHCFIPCPTGPSSVLKVGR